MTKERLETNDAREMVLCASEFLEGRGYAACVIAQAAGALLLANAMSVLEEHGHSEDVVADVEKTILAITRLVLLHVRDYDRDIRKLAAQEKMS